jgi:hypothetical protein
MVRGLKIPAREFQRSLPAKTALNKTNTKNGSTGRNVA